MTGKALQQPDGGVATATKQRVPVEDCEDEDNAKEASGEELDCLTSSLRGCSIQETTTLDIGERTTGLAQFWVILVCFVALFSFAHL